MNADGTSSAKHTADDVQKRTGKEGLRINHIELKVKPCARLPSDGLGDHTEIVGQRIRYHVVALVGICRRTRDVNELRMKA